MISERPKFDNYHLIKDEYNSKNEKNIYYATCIMQFAIA